jgi:hypothetical protein
VSRRVEERVVPPAWVPIFAAAPQLAATMLAYLDQIAVSLRPATVYAVETDLRDLRPVPDRSRSRCHCGG